GFTYQKDITTKIDNKPINKDKSMNFTLLLETISNASKLIFLVLTIYYLCKKSDNDDGDD
ncbi:hypothetical protein, partial [Yersinia enterocolitica]|uniref:hypothetical protein n=1 Tax=Yersinia enterocolitica TaxID=630 RepID=UPI0037D87066